MVSIIIPCYKDPYLQKTIDSLLENAQGKIEIIPVLDGYSPPKPLKKNKRVKPIVLLNNIGMRSAINMGIKKAKGKFIMKSDAHCIYGKGYDKIMARYCADNWLMIPRRYSLDDINWKRDDGRPARDYHFLTSPLETNRYGICMSSQDWIARGYQRSDPKYDIDDTMSFQGSCWFANRRYYLKKIGDLDDNPKTYGPFGGEQIEIGLKYWLGNGEIKVIKKTWYAHLFKNKRHYNSRLFSASYKRNKKIPDRRSWITKHWVNNEEPNMVHPFSWLIEKFWPVPTWPEDKKLWIFPKSRNL